MSTDYYVNERFIHDDLIEKAQRTVDFLYGVWSKDGKIDPILVTWPAETIKDDEGNQVEGACVLSLPHDSSKHYKAISAAIARTKAYGFLVIEQREKDVRVLLETPHGTRSWLIPIVKSADVYILGPAHTTVDKECIGFIWRPQRGAA